MKTVAFREALRLFGMITPSAPEVSAVLIIAPRLCGSSISSQIIMNGLVPLFLDIIILVFRGGMLYGNKHTRWKFNTRRD